MVYKNTPGGWFQIRQFLKLVEFNVTAFTSGPFLLCSLCTNHSLQTWTVLNISCLKQTCRACTVSARIFTQSSHSRQSRRLLDCTEGNFLIQVIESPVKGNVGYQQRLASHIQQDWRQPGMQWSYISTWSTVASLGLLSTRDAGTSWAGPKEGHKNNLRSRAPLLWRWTERVEIVQCGAGQALGRLHGGDLPVLKGGL